MRALTRQAFDLVSLHTAYAQGLDPCAVVDEVYRRIEASADPGIFLHLVEPSEAQAAARALDRFDPDTQPLWGVPFAIKDNIDAAGAPTTAGCPAFAYVANDDAGVVALLRQAGAILIGKTNLDQFATGLVGLRTPYPAPRNALDQRLVPGGSSSGSAVAVAAGLVGFALGTDTAGSGRVPAALNGIVGIKPTLGAISTRGVVPACRSLDTVSVFALTVEDAYRVLRVAAMQDKDDPYSRCVRLPPLSPAAPRVRVGVPDAATREFFGDHIQAAAFDATLNVLTARGAHLVPLDFTPFYETAALLYQGAWVAERFLVLEPLLHDNPEALHPVTRQIVERGATLSAADAFRDQYRLRALAARIAPLLDVVDLLCVPTIPTPYSVADVYADPIGTNSRLGTYTNFVNLLDLAGIAVPATPRSDGGASSVTLLARAGRDGATAAVAADLQHALALSPGATGWPLPDRPPPTPAVDSDEIALAVVGAHMSGLPLNRELTRLGSRFLHTGRTAARYRLYRLAGGPPLRPGLVCAPDGAAIELEVWAIPKGRFGDFICRVTRPLAIGTLELDDGTEVKGFLCEPDGQTGAEDITVFGGWRHYLATCSANTPCDPIHPSPAQSTTQSEPKQ